jgi:two-component system nitrate/nitrite response regulator NarL
MSTTTTSPCPVVVLGRPGITRDVVSHVLAERGHPALAPEGCARSSRPCVAVLVDPSDEHWVLARRLQADVVLVVTDGLDEAAFVDAIVRGADGILAADADPATVAEAVRVVGAGDAWLSTQEARLLVDALRSLRSNEPVVPQLTARERDILHSILQGHSVKQTARLLQIAPKTVENAQGRLFRKLGARNRAQAVQRAHELGFLQAPKVTDE